MNALLLADFFKRRWWFFALLMVLTWFATSFGLPVVLAPAALLILMFDGQRGYFRAVRPLPISEQAQARTLWFVGVVLTPLLSAVALLMVPLTVGAVGKFYSAEVFWFVAPLSWWFSLGLVSLVFILSSALSSRPPETIGDVVYNTILNAVWGVAIPLSMVIVSFMPKSAQELGTVHWVLIFLVPVFFFLSFLIAPAVARRRLFGTAGINQAGHIFVGKERSKGGMVGLPLLVMRMVALPVFVYILMMVTMLVLVPLFTKLFMPSRLAGAFSGSVLSATNLKSFGQHSIMFALVVGAGHVEKFNLRMLRQLPLSRLRILCLLLAPLFLISFLSALSADLLAHLSSDQTFPAFRFAAMSAMTFGFGSLAVTIILNMSSIARWIIYMMVIMIAMFTRELLVDAQELTLLGGVFVGGLSAFWLYYSLSRSSKIYQPRTPTGAALGQSFNGR